jgi:hypothetical protein
MVEWGSGHTILLIFMDYPSKNRRFQPLNRYFQGQNHYYNDGHLIQQLHDNGLPKMHHFDFFFDYILDRSDQQLIEEILE